MGRPKQREEEQGEGEQRQKNQEEKKQKIKRAENRRLLVRCCKPIVHHVKSFERHDLHFAFIFLIHGEQSNWSKGRVHWLCLHRALA